MASNDTFSRRTALKVAGAAGLGVAGVYGLSKLANNQLNIVIITTDDNDAESLGCYGCTLDNITPNLDALAKSSTKFLHAHTTSPTCQSSRLSLMTGRYPQTNGNTGHADPLGPDIPTLSSILGDAGYYTGTIGKQPHYNPESSFEWSRARSDDGEFLTADTWDNQSDGYWSLRRSPDGFYKGTRSLINESRKKNQPFFLHLNTQDPHRPWPGSVDEMFYLKLYEKSLGKKVLPMRPYDKNYSPWEVPVPNYLPDLPGVRVDLAQ